MQLQPSLGNLAVTKLLLPTNAGDLGLTRIGRSRFFFEALFLMTYGVVVTMPGL